MNYRDALRKHLLVYQMQSSVSFAVEIGVPDAETYQKAGVPAGLAGGRPEGFFTPTQNEL